MKGVCVWGGGGTSTCVPQRAVVCRVGEYINMCTLTSCSMKGWGVHQYVYLNEL